ncbi:hypothetical protein AgCh_035631 [Apium graveolens]
MATLERRISYSSLSSLEKENNKFNLTNDYNGPVWDEPDSQNACTSDSRSFKKDFTYEFPSGSEDFLDDGCDLSQDYNCVQHSAPEVNLKNVLSGIAAIVTGRNKDSSGYKDQQFSSSDVLFLRSEKNGDTLLQSSVYIPSAPPLLEPNGINYIAYRKVLQAEPPEWLPDSSSTSCMQCNNPFTALTRGRHHCRFCGGIFCRACSKGRCLMPVKFRERNPQRVCDTCYDHLDPLQVVLINTISNAAQVFKHDVVDWTCTRGWLNLPVGLSMEHEIYKSSSTLRSYIQVQRLNPEKSIPSAVLRGAKGLAILTVAKVGALLTYKLGTGLVVARRSDGSWSAPSAIGSVGLGWGAQVQLFSG